MSVAFDHRKIILETPRCVLCEMEPEDIEGMYALDSSALVHQYLGNSLFTEKRQAEEVIAHVQRQYKESGIGRWTVLEKKTGQFAGWAGIKWVKEAVNGYCAFYDIGYRFLPEFWGRGIATECASKIIEYAFYQMNILVLYAATHCENQASVSILKKAGFECNGTFTYFESDQYWFSLTRESWMSEENNNRRKRSTEFEITDEYANNTDSSTGLKLYKFH